MAQEFERYISTAGVSIGPEVNTGEIYRKYSTIFNDIDRLTRPIAQSLSNQLAVEQGEISGRNPGFKPGLAIGESSSIYNKSALASNRNAITADAIEKISSFRLKAMGLNPDGSQIEGSNGLTDKSIQEFNANIKGYFSGMMQTIPQENRDVFKNFVTAKSTIDQQSLITEFNKKKSIDAYYNDADQYNTINGQINQLLSYNNKNSTATAYDLLGKTIGAYRKNIDANPSLASKYEPLIAGMKKNFHQYQSLSIANGLPSAKDQIEYAERVRTDPGVVGHLGVSGANTLANEIVTIAKSRVQAEGVTGKQIEARMNSGIQYAYNHPEAPSNPENDGFISDYYSVKNESGNYDLYVQKRNNAALAGSYVKQAYSSNIDDINNIKSNIKSKLDEITSKSNISPEDADLSSQLLKAEKVVDGLSKQVVNDPKSFIQDTAGYKAIQRQIASDPDHHSQSELNDYVYNWQRNNHIKDGNIRFYTNDESSKWGNNFISADDNTKINMLNQVSNQFGEYSSMAFRNLQNVNKFGSDLNLLHETYNNDDTKKDAPLLYSSMMSKDNDPIFKSVPSTQTNEFQSVIGSSEFKDFSATLHEQGIIGPQVTNYANIAAKFSRYLQGSLGLKQSDAQKRAINTVLSSHITTPSFNGYNYIITKTDQMGKDVDDLYVKAALHYLTSLAINGDESIAIPAGVSKKQYGIHVRAEARIKNIGNDGWQIVDRAGIPIEFKDRSSTIGYHEFRDLDSNPSNLMKAVSKDIINKYGSLNRGNIQKYVDENLPDVPDINTDAFLESLPKKRTDMERLPEGELEMLRQIK